MEAARGRVSSVEYVGVEYAATAHGRNNRVAEKGKRWSMVEINAGRDAGTLSAGTTGTLRQESGGGIRQRKREA